MTLKTEHELVRARSERRPAPEPALPTPGSPTNETSLGAGELILEGE